jgi:tellurite resistance protein
MARTRIPLNLFGIPFGLAELGESWQIMAGFGRAPGAVADVLFLLSALAWLAALLAYLRYLRASGWAAFGRDLTDPVAAPFASLAVIVPMLLAGDALYPHAATAGRVLVGVFLALTVLAGAWFTGQWIYRPLDLDKLHPGYFLPTVAGGLIAAAAAAEIGQRRLAEAMFGLGLLCWLVLGSIVMNRLFFRPLPPDPLLPTLAIEVAPPAVATLAYFAIRGGRIDPIVVGIGGYGLLMALAQLRLLPAYLRLPFMLSTWAFTFSWAAVASATLVWLHDDRLTGWEYLVLAAITVLIGGIAIRTVVALARRQLLPHPAPATADDPAVPTEATR